MGFCLKTACRFTTHASKSNLAGMKPGTYYIKENKTHSHRYLKLCLSPKVALLAPLGLLVSQNIVVGWKAIIQQLEEHWAAGATEPEVVAAQAAGLPELAERVMKTPYATTPMQSTCRCTWIDLDDKEVKELEGGEEGDIMILQCLEDSIGHQRGEIGMWATDARYITLHGGVQALHWAKFTFTSSMTSRLDPGACLEDYAQGLP
jgi:hypothetical protein